jgi:penicillin-binding protein 1A
MPRSKLNVERRKITVKFYRPQKKLSTIIVPLMLFAAFTAAALFYFIAHDLPAVDDLPDRLSYTSFIYNEDGSELIATLNSAEYRMNVNYAAIPEYVKLAFIATEDERFFKHFGVDIRATLRAVRTNLTEGSMAQGGSTITQQLAKNVYLTQDKKIMRKLQEWVLAVRIERQYDKDRILEMYLNQVFLGYNAYGVEAAAIHYFGKNADQLSLGEAAMLAGIARAPNALSPRNYFEQAKVRQATVLQLMIKNRFISESQATAAKSEEIIIAPLEKPKYKYPYFVDYVLQELLTTYGAELVYRGGLSVYTTIDPQLQQDAEDAVREILDSIFPPDRNDPGPEVALITADPATGYIKAMVGGRKHEYVLGLNRVLQPRQPGSAFKPVAVFAPAIANGYSPESVILDAPLTLRVGPRTWSPKNYDNRYLGLVSLREAAARSINTVAVRVFDDIGVEVSLAAIQAMGITTLELENSRINDYGPAIALGGLTRGVTPLELNAAYGVFASGGYRADPVAVIRIVDRNGRVLLERTPKLHPVLDAGAAYLVTDMLKDTITKSYGTAARNGYIGRPAAAKTGTSSDIRDAWFVGYTPDRVTTVWMGYDRDKNMSQIYGGGYPALIWNRVMRTAHQNLPSRDFSITGKLVQVSICGKSGLLPSPQCSPADIIPARFVEGKQPKDMCYTCALPRTPPSDHNSGDSRYPRPGDTYGEPYDPNQYYNPVIPQVPPPEDQGSAEDNAGAGE